MIERNDSPQQPKGWVCTRLEDIAEINLGQSPPSSTYNEERRGLPFYQGKSEFGEIYPTPRIWCSAPKKIAEKGDVLISVRAPVGPTNICPDKSAIGRGLAAIRGLDPIQPLFILYLIRAFENEIASKGTGSTFSAISGNQLKQFQIPLAPLTEQRRIVAKIEELFCDLDAGVAALQETKAQLKRYRQAVLKAAVEGRLTAEWRAANAGKIEPASALLERIRAERAKNANAKAKPLPRVDAAELRALPEGWEWVTLQELSWDAGYGTSVKCDYGFDGAAVLRIPNIAKGRIDLTDLKCASNSDSAHFDPAESLATGDLLIVRTNGSRDLIGRAALVSRDFDSPHYFASYLIRFRLMNLECLPLWINTFWDSTRNRAWIEGVAATTAGQYNVSMTVLNRMPVPLPPLAEQQQIIAEVERRLSVADVVEKTVDASLKQAERLRQSILKRAFAGKLVPQDPSDEPAERLLERIREQRNSSNTHLAKQMSLPISAKRKSNARRK